MLINPREPFDLALTLRSILSPPILLNRRQFAPLLDYFEDGEYRRVAQIRGEPVLYGVPEARRGADVLLRVRILAGPRDEETKREVRALVKRQFSVSLDLNPFYQVAGSDPVLRKLLVHFRGMRIPQSVSVYETLRSAILEQQVSLSFAHPVKKALIEAYGNPVEHQGRRGNAFPEPAALAITAPSELRRLQISGPKARYLIGISRAAVDGSLDLEALRWLGPAEASARLQAHKGIGSWTPQYVGLRALGHLDCFPAADVGLQNAIQHFYGLRKQPSAARVEQFARNWAGWRSYATFYLWLTFWEDTAWKEQVIRELRSERHRAFYPTQTSPARTPLREQVRQRLGRAKP